MLKRTPAFIVIVFVLGCASLYVVSRATPYRCPEPNATEGGEVRMRQLQEDLDACIRRSDEHGDARGAAASSGSESIPAAPIAQLASRSSPANLSSEQRMFAERRRYGLLFREMDLSDEQQQNLLRILIERPLDTDAIAEVLGTEKAAQFETGRRTLFDRAEIRLLRDDLELTGGELLSPTQQHELLAKLTAHNRLTPPTRLDGEAPAEAAARTSTWLDARDEALRDAADGVLTPNQLQLVEESMALRRARATFRERGPGSGAAGSPSTSR